MTSSSETAASAEKGKGSAKARRSAARLSAVQALYQIDMADSQTETVLREYLAERLGMNVDGDEMVKADEQLFSDIVRGASYRKAELDPMIAKAMGRTDEAFQRIEPLLRGIFRAGSFELFAQPQTPTGIIINDYVEVARAFFEGQEPKLVNAVLDRIGKVLRADTSGIDADDGMDGDGADI